MNYFAHGRSYTDRPYFLAGTAVPDWLGVIDRKVRLREKLVLPFADGSGSATAELAAGLLQHFEDDQWFHNSPAFYETSGKLTRLFRDALGTEDGHRSSFLGHIVTEIILDGYQIEENPHELDAYYDAIAGIDPNEIQRAVNLMARKSTTKLSLLIPRFHQEQFLRDYQQPHRLLYRLNQVMKRIKLSPLPASFEQELKEAQTIVKPKTKELLGKVQRRESRVQS